MDSKKKELAQQVVHSFGGLIDELEKYWEENTEQYKESNLPEASEFHSKLDECKALINNLKSKINN